MLSPVPRTTSLVIPRTGSGPMKGVLAPFLASCSAVSFPPLIPTWPCTHSNRALLCRASCSREFREYQNEYFRLRLLIDQVACQNPLNVTDILQMFQTCPLFDIYSIISIEILLVSTEFIHFYYRNPVKDVYKVSKYMYTYTCTPPHCVVYTYILFRLWIYIVSQP